MKNSRDLIFGEVVYITIIYHINEGQLAIRSQDTRSLENNKSLAPDFLTNLSSRVTIQKEPVQCQAKDKDYVTIDKHIFFLGEGRG